MLHMNKTGTISNTNMAVSKYGIKKFSEDKKYWIVSGDGVKPMYSLSSKSWFANLSSKVS